MRIMFLSKILTKGGSAIHQYSLAKALLAKGHEVCIVSGGPIDDPQARERFEASVKDGVEHHIIGFPHAFPMGVFHKSYLLLRYIVLVPRFLLFAFKYKPDVIHVHYPVTSYLAKIYSLLTGKKYVVTYHIGGIPDHILHYRGHYAIAISSALKQELKTRFSYQDEQICLIHNGVSHLKFDGKTPQNRIALCDKYTIPCGKTVIGFVGELSERKGIDVLCEALGEIDDDYHLVLVGDGDRRWVEKLITRYRLSKNVTIVPFQDPYELYQLFDFLVLPSRKEGFPLVVIEAMLMGKAIIRSNTEGAADQIEHGVNGFLFRNEDVDRLRKYCKLLLQDKSLREQMGREARARALERFTEKSMVDKTVDLYHRAAKGVDISWAD